MLEIRPEIEADQAAIHEVTALAFRDRPYADGDEQEVVDRLRSAGALTLSLVAIDEDQVIGQVTFSPAALGNSRQPWFALGPVSVLPKHQGDGIGSALITQGLGQIKKLGALGCILTGNPAYYQRFGFELAPQNVPQKESPEYFMVKRFRDDKPQGRFAFHEAFYE